MERSLMTGEEIIIRTRLHWIIFFKPLVFLLAAAAGFAAGLNLAVYLCIPAALWTGLPSLMNYLSTEFGVTNKRIFFKTGLLKRHSLEVLLKKIGGIAVKQGISGRIFGYGTVIVTATGGGIDPLHKVTAPLEFRRQVQELISDA